jgi:hypothetical protein
VIVDAGDTVTLRWEHRDPITGAPADPATATAVRREVATATDTTLTVTHPAVGTYQAEAAFPTSGDWLIIWTSTGPAEVDEYAVYARPAGQAASWAPTLRRVASFIPSRTRAVVTDNNPVGTFNDDTWPTGDMVDELVGSAVAVVSGRVGTPVAIPAYGLAQTAAALWTAWMVELGYPERDADVQAYSELRKEAENLIKQATAVNIGAGGGTDVIPDVDGRPDVLSMWSFPDPVPFTL